MHLVGLHKILGGKEFEALYFVPPIGQISIDIIGMHIGVRKMGDCQEWKNDEEAYGSRESNPGRKNGNLTCYHYTTTVVPLALTFTFNVRDLK